MADDAADFADVLEANRGYAESFELAGLPAVAKHPLLHGYLLWLRPRRPTGARALPTSRWPSAKCAGWPRDTEK